MSEKLWITPEGGIKIAHKGVLELPDFYRWVQEWLELEGYWKKSNEKIYIQKMTQAGKEIFFSWECKKDETDEYTYVIKINYLFTTVNDMEVPYNGAKIKVQKGNFGVTINAYVERNISLPPILKKIYEKWIDYKQEEYLAKHYETVYKLQQELKEYFGQYVY